MSRLQEVFCDIEDIQSPLREQKEALAKTIKSQIADVLQSFNTEGLIPIAEIAAVNSGDSLTVDEHGDLYVVHADSHDGLFNVGEVTVEPMRMPRSRILEDNSLADAEAYRNNIDINFTSTLAQHKDEQVLDNVLIPKVTSPKKSRFERLIEDEI